MRTLVVEDEQTTRTLIRSLVEARAHDVTECSTAEDGWEAYQRNPYPLVLLNWMLPGASGLDLCRRIRAHPRGSSTFVLVVTGRTDVGALRQVLDAGADDYFPKPIDPAGFGVRLTIAERRAEELRKQLRASREHRRLAAKMEQAQKLESLGVLAGGIAHDFNNLLVGILGHANLALMDLDPASPLRRDIEKIEHSATRASELTNQLLAYAGKGRFKVERVQLNDVVREMAELLDVSRSKSVSLVYAFSNEDLWVDADPTQLRQVVMNLITNASDAVGDNPGTVRVETGKLRLDDENQTSSFVLGPVSAGEYHYFDVSDDGCGMDVETVARIFDPFFTTKSAGRGLGLAAVLGIVRSHGGTVSVDSRPGRGTAIRIYLPAEKTEMPRAVERLGLMVDVGSWRGDGTVLVADDEEGVRVVTKALLEKLGFSVILAANGAEAASQLEDHDSDVVAAIVDMTMPGWKTEQVVQALRTVRSDLPIILCSGYSQAEAAKRLGAVSVFAFLQKPFRPAALVDMLRRATGDRRARHKVRA